MTVTRIQFRRGTAAAWTDADPVLASSERGYQLPDEDFPNGRWKTGKDSLNWTDLPYDDDPEVAFPTSTAEGRAVLTGDAAEGRTALSVVGRGDRPRNILDYGVSIGTASSQTAAIKAALNAYPGASFVFPRGDYRLDTGLVVDSSNSLRIDHDARIYAAAAMDTLITYDNGEASSSNWAEDKCIVGEGTLDGALLANKVLSIARVIRVSVDDFTIVDGINRGLYTGSLGAEVIFRNVRIHNTGTTNVTDNIAIESNMGDCLFQDFIIRDYTVGVRDNGSSVWSNVHPWLGALSQLTARYANSIGFDLNGNSVLINPYADTYRTSYKVQPGKRARILTPRAFCNQGNLSDALAAANPGTVLDLDSTSVVQFTGAELEGHPTTSHTFITGSPTRLTAHTNNVVRGVTGLADYRNGVQLRVPEQHLPAAYDDFTATDGAAVDSGRWTVSTGGAAAAGVVVNGNRARLTSGATGSYSATDRAFMKSTLAAVADVELLLRHTYGVVATESYTRYAVRSANTDPQSGNSYFVAFTNTSIVLTKRVSGVETNIGGGSFAFLGLPAITDGASLFLRFRVKGTFVAFKVWVAGTDEPVAWTSATTDSSISAAGNVVAAISGGSAAASGVSYVDRFSITPLDDIGLAEAVAAGLNSKQPIDGDLTAISALAPSDDDLLQRKSGSWTNRTIAQLKTDLGLSGANTGDQSSIVGITGTTAEFNTALTDGNFATLDANANLTADSFISSKTSTATSAGTLVMTIADTQVQEFTGSTTHIVRLPTTGVIAGQSYTIVNNSSGAVSVLSSGANTVASVAATRVVIVTARIDTPTGAADWQVTGLYATAGAAASTLAMRDATGNLYADAFIPSFTTTPTAAGTTVLTVNSFEIQEFTGSTTQTVTLPTTSVVAGHSYRILNSSSGAVTVNASGGALVKTVAAGGSTVVTSLVATPTTAAHWFASA